MSLREAMLKEVELQKELPFSIYSIGGRLMARTKFADEATHVVTGRLHLGAEVYWKNNKVYTYRANENCIAGRIKDAVRFLQRERVEKLKHKQVRPLYANHIQASGFNCSAIIFKD